MKKYFLAAAIGAPAFVPADAAPLIYSCDLSSEDNLVGRKILFQVDGDLRQALVYDGMIKAVKGEPLMARIVVENANRTTLQWAVGDIPLNRGGGRATATFTATILKKGPRVNVWARLNGYDNDESGYGACEILPREKS